MVVRWGGTAVGGRGERGAYRLLPSPTQRVEHTWDPNPPTHSSHTSKYLERPNTDASFSVSRVDKEVLAPSAANVLHARGISDLLKHYPN